jgi:hypothetical protein
MPKMCYLCGDNVLLPMWWNWTETSRRQTETATTNGNGRSEKFLGEGEALKQL